MRIHFLGMWLLLAPLAFGWDREKALQFLETRQQAWAVWKPAQKQGGPCLSCHTGLSYLLARRAMGKTEPWPSERELVAGVRARVAPPVATLPDEGAEAVLNVLTLALQRTNPAAPLDAGESAAVARLWEKQQQDGSWTWVNADLHPMDSEHSNYWGTALVEKALQSLPPGPSERVAAMREYLRREAARQPLHHRLAWLAFGKAPAVLPELWAKQGRDGGWSTAALGPWTEQKEAPADKGSNAYATAWAAYAARESGVACTDARLRRALGWLAARQDPATGAWKAVSMNKVYPPGSIQEGFLTDAATGFAVAVLGSCDGQLPRK